MGKIKLVLIKSQKEKYDISDLVESVTWSGRKGAAPRSISVTMLDDASAGHKRAGINVAKGHKLIFYWNKKELFRGIIMHQQQSHQRKLVCKAYDNMIYIANNKDSFSYEKKTLEYIYKDCMTRLGVAHEKPPEIAYVIPEVAKSKTTYWDILQDAMSQTYKGTGVRYYISSSKNVISLKRRKEQVTQWLLEPGRNLSTYTYTKSTEDTKTRIRLLSKEGQVLREENNPKLEKYIGVFQDVDTPDKDANEAQLKSMIAEMMKESSKVKQELSIEALGVTSAVAGGCVYAKIPHLKLGRTFYIDEDTHTFSGNVHTMKLKLNFASSIGEAGEV